MQALASLAVLLATIAAYFPALHGAVLWDDAAHITPVRLQSLSGLWSIWFRLGSTQQYYPLLHSAFWFEHRLWGDAVEGYHLANIVLHALGACLFAQLLSRLSPRPGPWGPWAPWLAALVFALHPVCVESVAWISEQKNTLSLVLYLLSALAYLRFDSDRSARWYLCALALFVAAVLTKSVTATLPAALLLMVAWRRGELSLRRDVMALLPWFAIALPAGLFTAWVERTLIGAHGASFELGAPGRVYLAGTVVWFYLGKLLWPFGLSFIYPRWTVGGAWPWALGPALLAGALCLLWRMRRRHGSTLLAALFFVGSLFPALGFFNVYPFRFSYVADHFQYLASLGVIAYAVLGTAGMVEAARSRLGPDQGRRVGRLAAGLAAGLLVLLFLLTRSQAGLYGDQVTLYTDTLSKNPDCWMADSNLGVCLLERGRATEAISHLRKAVRLKPDYADGHNNLGNALSRMPDGQAEAVREFEAAVALEPLMWQAHGNLGRVLSDEPGRLGEAVAELGTALKLAPPDGTEAADLHARLGAALERSPGRLAEAISEYRLSLAISPLNASVRSRLGLALDRAGDPDLALKELRGAVEAQPGNAEAQKDLANVLVQIGHDKEALGHYRDAIRADPKSADAHFFLGRLLYSQGDSAGALSEYREAIGLAPGSPEMRSSLGSLLYRQGQYPAALDQYAEAVRLRPDSAVFQSNLGLVLMKLGRRDDAVRAFRRAILLDPGFAPARQGLAAAESGAAGS
jgi:tetratricopeptide (TPR) repeat protein